MKPLILKALIKIMATESCLLRRESYRQQRKLREMVCRQRLTTGNLTEVQVNRILRKARGKLVEVTDQGLTEEALFHRMYPNSLNLKRAGLTETDPGPPKKEWMDEKVALINYLQGRRRGPLRESARAAQLAYAFLRGRSYAQTENLDHQSSPKGSNEIVEGSIPDWANVRRFANTYATLEPQNDNLDIWIEEAKAYRANHGKINEKIEKEKDAPATKTG